MSWTEDRIEILKKLWADGLSASQIAAQLGGGVSRNAVIGKVHRLNLANRVKAAPNSVNANAKTNGKRTRVSFSQKATLEAEDFSETKPAINLDPDPILKENNISEIIEKDDHQERRLNLLELTERTCKWPVGDPLASDFYFCGSDSEETSPYCKYHSKIAFQTFSDRRRKVI